MYHYFFELQGVRLGVYLSLIHDSMISHQLHKNVFVIPKYVYAKLILMGLKTPLLNTRLHFYSLSPEMFMKRTTASKKAVRFHKENLLVLI